MGAGRSGGQLLGNAVEKVSAGTPACLVYGAVPYLYICAENDKINEICEQYAVTYDCKKLSYMLYVKIIDCFGRLSKCQN